MTGPAGSDSFSGAPALTLEAGDTVTCAATDMTTKTLESGEPTQGGSDATQTAWWKFVAPSTRTYLFDTELSATGADTVVSVYTGSSVGALTLVGYDDDGGVNALSRLQVVLTAGVTYWVQATPYGNGDANSIVLRVAMLGPPPANNDFADAAVITFGSTSPPASSATATVEPDEVISSAYNRTVWWKYTATTSQTVGFDTRLTTRYTTEVSDFDTVIEIFTGSSLTDLLSVAFADDNDIDDSWLTQLDFDVVAGTTYWIRVASSRTSLSMDYVLRVGSATRVTLDWQDGPDRKIVWGRPTVGTQPFHIPSTFGFSSGPNWAENYQGKKQLNKSFGGPHPAGIPEAINCCWRHARRYGVGGFSYWSPGNHVEWLGGPGDCPPMPTSANRSNSGFVDHPVGFYYHRTGTSGIIGGGSGDFSFRMYGVSVEVSLHDNVRRIRDYQQTPVGENYDATGTAAYVAAVEAAGYTDVVIEWEDPDEFVPELTALEVAGDEPTTSSTVGPSVTTKWYAGLPADYVTVSTPTRWGPQYIGALSSPGDQGGIEFGGDASGPESLLLGWEWLQDYGGGTSGFTNISSDLLADCWAYEESWVPSGGDPLDYFGYGSLVLVGMPDGCFTDSPPGQVAPYDGTGDVTNQALRLYQIVALRTTTTQPRYRVSATPPPTDIGRLKVWSDVDDEWLWQGEGSVSGETGVGRFKVWTGSSWEIAEPVPGEGGVGRMKVWDGASWRTTLEMSP